MKKYVHKRGPHGQGLFILKGKGFGKNQALGHYGYRPKIWKEYDPFLCPKCGKRFISVKEEIEALEEEKKDLEQDLRSVNKLLKELSKKKEK